MDNNLTEAYRFTSGGATDQIEGKKCSFKPTKCIVLLVNKMYILLVVPMDNN